MKYRILGRTGLEVSEIGIGMWQLSGPLTVDDKQDGFPDPGVKSVGDLIRACGDFGINLIDTAEIYGDGEGERRAGAAIKGQRDRWILSTKFGLRQGEQGERIADTRPEMIRTSLEKSLKNLQTDYVDIYLYHTAPNPDQIAECASVLHKLRRQGKIRYFGISSNSFDTVQQLLKHDSVEIILLSQSLVTHASRLLSLASRNNLGVMVRGALESGRLSGKYFEKEPRFSDDDIRKRLLAQNNFQKYDVYSRLLPDGVSMVAFALRYLLDYQNTNSIILGGSSINHYREALEAVDMRPLDPKIHHEIGQIRERLNMVPLSKRILRRAVRTARRILRPT